MRKLSQAERESLVADYVKGRRQQLGLQDTEDSKEEAKESVRSISKRYGVSYQTACDIIVSFGHRAGTRQTLKRIEPDILEKIEGAMLEEPPQSASQIAQWAHMPLQRVRRIMLELLQRSA